MNELESLLSEVKTEVERATSMHGSLASLHEAYSVIAEEFDEFWDEVKINPRKLTESEKAQRRSNIREELIQVAAMCIRTLMDVTI